MTTNKRGKDFLGLPDTDEIKTAYQTARYRKTFWETVTKYGIYVDCGRCLCSIGGSIFLPILRIYGKLNEVGLLTVEML